MEIDAKALGLIMGNCPECGAETELHQPCLDRPERLLVTCLSARCGTWWVLNREVERISVAPIAATDNVDAAVGLFWKPSEPSLADTE